MKEGNEGRIKIRQTTCVNDACSKTLAVTGNTNKFKYYLNPNLESFLKYEYLI